MHFAGRLRNNDFLSLCEMVVGYGYSQDEWSEKDESLFTHGEVTCKYYAEDGGIFLFKILDRDYIMKAELPLEIVRSFAHRQIGEIDESYILNRHPEDLGQTRIEIDEGILTAAIRDGINSFIGECLKHGPITNDTIHSKTYERDLKRILDLTVAKWKVSWSY